MASPPGAILVNSGHVDLSTRHKITTTVAASPSAATETTIATLTISNNVVIADGIRLRGWAAFTIGTNGVSWNLKIRQTNTSGATIAASGVIALAAASLASATIIGNDTAAVIPGQVYVLTLTIASGSATSTVSGCALEAEIV